MSGTDIGGVNVALPLERKLCGGKVSTRGLLVFLAVWAALLALALLFDARIGTWFDALAHQSPVFLRVMKLSNRLFSYLVYFAVAGVLLLQRDRWRLLLGYVIPVGACFGVVHLMKFIVGRARPDQNFGPFYFNLFGDPFAGQDALPSAHTAAAVLLTALLFRYCPHSAWLLVPAAVLASLSRVAQERHYLSDVIVGAGIPLLFVWLCVQLLGPQFYPRLTWRTTSDSNNSENHARSA